MQKLGRTVSRGWWAIMLIWAVVGSLSVFYKCCTKTTPSHHHSPGFHISQAVCHKILETKSLFLLVEYYQICREQQLLCPQDIHCLAGFWLRVCSLQGRPHLAQEEYCLGWQIAAELDVQWWKGLFTSDTNYSTKWRLWICQEDGRKGMTLRSSFQCWGCSSTVLYP